MTRFLSTDELHLAFVTSKKAHAKLLKVDPSAALAMPGVVDFITSNDIPGDKMYGSFGGQDEEVFASEKVMISLRPSVKNMMYRNYK